MCKRLVSCLLCLCLLAGCSTTVSKTVPESKAPDSPYAVAETILPAIEPDHLCSAQENASQDIAEAVNSQLLITPRWLRVAFCESGWKMQVVPYDIATEDYPGEFLPGDVLASTSYRDSLIKVLNQRQAAATAPVHELGHWLDSMLGYPTLNDEEYQRIYEEEGQAYRDAYGPACSWNSQEFFAEGFWCYWKSPSSLRRNCPLFYNYLTRCLNEVKNLTDG